MNYDKYTDEELRDMLKYMIMQLSDKECVELMKEREYGLPRPAASQ